MKLFTFFLFIIITISFFGIGRTAYETNNTINIYNFTNELQWNDSIIDKEIEIFNQSASMQDINRVRIMNIIRKTVNVGGFILLEFVKWGIEVGYNKPEWNYLFFSRLLFYLILGLYVLPLLGFIPYILALIYLVFTWLRKLYYYIKSRRLINGSTNTGENE